MADAFSGLGTSLIKLMHRILYLWYCFDEMIFLYSYECEVGMFQNQFWLVENDERRKKSRVN